MKKMFFYAALASVAFVSCSKDVEVPSTPESNENQQAIKFQMSSNIDVTTKTRGTGAVGGTEAEGNSWAGQTLNVYMFDQGTLTPTYNATTSANYFENTEVTAPSTGATGTASYGAEQYYPSNGSFDFFAYHGDDAVTEVPALNDTEDAYTVNVTIDGTQDLMVAKACLNGADSTTYEKNAKYDYKRIYSAYSARRGVQPRFTFQHLLSRFVFQAEAAEAAANGIKITKIEVEAPSTGVMTVAALDKNDLGVQFDENSLRNLTLKNRAAAMDVVSLDIAQGLTRLGESMLLPAGGATKYVAKIYYEQEKNGDIIREDYEATIALKNNAPFVAGTQYKVNVKVYGFQKIELTCDLAAWVEGEDIPVDSEE